MAAAKNSVAKLSIGSISDASVEGSASITSNIKQGGAFNMAAAKDSVAEATFGAIE